MQLKYRLPLVIVSALALSVLSLHAQEDDDDEEEFGGFGFFSGSSQSMTTSLKLTQGPKVNFSNLGDVPFNLVAAANKQYMDGVVNADGRRPAGAANGTAELDINGQPLYGTGGRYQSSYLDANGNTVSADYLAYDNGKTRSWTYVNASQALTKPGYIAFNIYGALTQGASLQSTGGYTGGVELTVNQLLTDPKKKITFSINAGLTLTGINISKSGQVNSTLHTYTDYYNHFGATPEQLVSTNTNGNSYEAPSGLNTILDGNKVSETTVAISQNAEITEETNLVDGVKVDGTWKIKGAYFTFKVGPQVTAMLTRRIGVTASAGVAGSYIGTTYSSAESFEVAGVAAVLGRDPETSTTNKFLPGYYANLDATWAVNDRTGLFAGVSYENLGDYRQNVGVRTAKIDLSATAGVRGGLSIKF